MIKIITLAVAALLVGLDQWIKAWAYTGLEQRITVIPGVFYLTYLENTGAAFGLFQGRALALGIVSIVILAAVIYFLLSGKAQGHTLIWGLTLILAGGVGNLIDRLVRGFVIDYLDFSALFGFPIFNLADCFVVVGTALMMVHILFFDKKKPEPVAGQPDTPPGNEDIPPTGDGQTSENS